MCVLFVFFPEILGLMSVMIFTVSSLFSVA